MKTFAAVLIAICLAGSLAAGEVCIRTQSQPQNCQSADTCRPVEGRGTGVVVDRNSDGTWIIATAKHVLQDAAKTWIGINGEWVPVKSRHFLNSTDDFACLVVALDYPLKPVKIADDDAPVGDRICFSGYSAGQTHQKVCGFVRELDDVGVARCETRPKEGQSGGGVYDRDGRLVGIVVGYHQDNGDLVYTPIARVRRACQRQWGMWFGVGAGSRPNPPAPKFKRNDVPPATDTVPAAPPVETIPAPVETPAPKTETLRADLDQLILRFEQFQALPGPRGPAGPVGPAGESFDPSELERIHSKIESLAQAAGQVEQLAPVVTAIKTALPNLIPAWLPFAAATGPVGIALGLMNFLRKRNIEHPAYPPTTSLASQPSSMAPQINVRPQAATSTSPPELVPVAVPNEELALLHEAMAHVAAKVPNGPAVIQAVKSAAQQLKTKSPLIP